MFCSVKVPSHCGVNRYASDPRIGLMDSTVSVEALVRGEHIPVGDASL
ncbi:MAG: hypothetical protein J6T59_01570 [Bacteroidales bacterium]|nr:hypothetical protein [Bacteroidales bacterium]